MIRIDWETCPLSLYSLDDVVMNSRPVFFLDLDGTIIYSKRIKSEKMVTVGAHSINEEPNGWYGPNQKQLMEWLMSSGDVVITTGRSLSGTQRALLPFSGWKICCFGGLILSPNGEVHAPWVQHIDEYAKGQQDWIQTEMAAIQEFITQHKIDVRTRIVPITKQTDYYVIKHNQKDLARFDKLVDFVSSRVPSGWFIHCNANNISVLPPQVRKSNAVCWIQENIFPNRLYVGIGDSLSDLDYFKECHFSMVPKISQIMNFISSSI